VGTLHRFFALTIQALVRLTPARLRALVNEVGPA